jgi:hypothetical protein
MKYPYSYDYMKKYRSSREQHKNVSVKALDYMTGKVAAQRKAEEMIKQTTHSRVFKKFTRKVLVGIILPILYIAAWIGSSFLVAFLGVPEQGAVLITTVFFVLIPGLGIALRHMYKESKAEIERENRDLMRNLTDGYN